MNGQLLERINTCSDLPSLPSIAVEVLELAQAAEADLNRIAAVISRDPALTGKILRTVNSSFYGRPRNVATISQAMVVLGLQSVKTLVMGFSLVTGVSAKKAKGFDHTKYWKHSLFTATAARLIAQKLNVVQVEEVFLGALLADIGMLVLDRVVGDAYGEIAKGSHDSLCEAEMRAFETTHAEVSGHLVTSWKLPPLLTTPITYHENPSAVAEPTLRKLAEVIEVASRIADVFSDTDAAPAIAELRGTYFTKLGIDAVTGEAMMAQIQAKAKENATLFDIAIGDSEPYEKVLQRANDALVRMMLQTQQQTATLQLQNEELRQQATTDRLTGLSNRADFESRSDALWSAALASGKPLSMVMLDLDHFKKINDTHGHPAGDEVLRTVGAALKKVARPMDLVARFGGEEMVLVLPETDRPTAAAIAESLRIALRSKPVTTDGVTINITASFGVSSVEPGSPVKSPAHLLKAADLALYQAKRTGRDRVKVFQPIAVQAA